MPSSAHRTTQPSAKPKRRRWASINVTAEHLGVTERTVRQMIVDGRLTGYRLSPKFIRLDLDEVDAALTPYGGGVSSCTRPNPAVAQADWDDLDARGLLDVVEHQPDEPLLSHDERRAT